MRLLALIAIPLFALGFVSLVHGQNGGGTYTLTVNGGSGSGSYDAGTIVNIVADAAPVGQEFDQWTGDVGIVEDVSAASTSITMPEGDATVTATYKALQYILTVNNGTGSGSYTAGTIVNIVADPAPVGQEFDQWTGDVGIVDDVGAASTSITMPEGDATVTATYTARQYTLTVNNGTGSGSYPASTVVNIVAADAPAGLEFHHWTGNVGIIDDVNAASTSLTMPAGDATVTATYRARHYFLTVNNGTGSGSYLAGTIVDIVADPAPVGQEFDQWTGDVISVFDVGAASTSITIPGADATVTATYKARQYVLTVNNGTGSGSYTAGTIVNIVADPAPVGQEFDQWTGEVGIIDDASAASTTLTMPEGDAAVTATYKARQFTLTVNNGTGSGSYTAGTIVDIVADPAPAGQEFDQWTGEVGIIDDASAASTTLTMPEGDATVTATYKARQYTLTVNSGTGSGSYTAGTIVDIVADPAPAGQEFDQWTGEVGIIDDASAASTTLTMPEGDATVTATYKARQYTLTVNSGTGSGSYTAGTIVDIVADPAPVGQEFDQWTGEVGIVDDASAASTAVTMPEGDATVTATYQSVPRTLTVNGGTGSGTYVAGTIVNIVAAAAPAGQEFDQWTGDVATVANVNAASTSITMPGADATVTATYRARRYTLTVNSGSGSGGYAAGVNVNIVADTAPAGLQFDRWTGDVGNVANVTAASTSITMPAADITVTATYKTRQYTLTVNSGTGSGSYSFGATVNIVAAAAPAGQEFDRWTGDVAQVLNVNAASTFLTMPAANTTVSATYKARRFTLTVNSGTGSGSYTAGTTVNIVAAAAPAGQEFDRWTGDISAVGNVNAASTFLTMPTANTSVTATYRARQFRLTVNGGSGAGNYAAGTVVNIEADAAPAGQEFDRWTGDVANVVDVNAASTSITILTADATVTANYKARLYSLTVSGGSGSGSFAVGATVNIVAAPAPADSEFDQWTGDVANVVNVLAASTFITMPAADATVTATYKLLPRTLTVNGGSGSGSYVPGTSVNIVAATAPVGQEFDQWTGDIANVVDVNAASTSITMPLTDATVTATFKLRSYTLTVNSGTGSGSFLAGTIVDIEADPPPADQEFDRWIGNVANVADVNVAATSITMPTAEVTVTAVYRLPGGVSGIGPLDFLTATGNAGLITTINGIPVSDLVLGVTAFPTPNVAFPAVNADNFNLGSVASADGQPYFECTFAQPVTTVFLIENGGNDSGMVQGYDAAGNRMGTAVAFTTADYLRTEYRSGNNQVVAGLIVRLTAPVHAIRVLPPASGALGFDPLSISAVPAAAPPVASLQWQWNPVAGSWELVWEGDSWVLQDTAELDAGWSDVSPTATSPYVVTPEEPLRFFRLREAGPE